MRPRAGNVRERGAVLITFAIVAAFFFCMLGTIIDLGQAINRHAELQAIADSAALKGAMALNGSAPGIANAVAAARSGFYAVRYASRQMVLPDSAMSFAASPDAAPAQWKSVAAATNAPAGLLFMRVDASQAAGTTGIPSGRISTFFIRVLAPGMADIDVGAEATAGRFGSASQIVQLYR